MTIDPLDTIGAAEARNDYLTGRIDAPEYERRLDQIIDLAKPQHRALGATPCLDSSHRTPAKATPNPTRKAA